VSVTVSGDVCAGLAEEQLRDASGRSKDVHEADGDPTPRIPCGEGGQLLDETLRPAVDGRCERGLVSRRDDDGVDAGALGAAQDVPAADRLVSTNSSG
jgi:hypothetical protein